MKKLTTKQISKFDCIKDTIKKHLTADNVLKTAVFGAYVYAAYIVDDADLLETLIEDHIF